MRGTNVPVSLIVSTERSGIDRYGQELAKRLPVSTIYTARYRAIRRHVRLATTLARFRHPVHLPNQHFARWIAWLGPPTIVTVHDLVRLAFPYTRERTIGVLGLVLDRRGIRRAAHVISVSGATKRDLMHHLGIPEERITVIHNGIDHSVFKPRREKFQSDNFRPYVLYVGSERPRKNLSALLRAFALLKGQGPPFDSLTLLKVGTPGRAAAFRAGCSTLARSCSHVARSASRSAVSC